MTVFDKDTLSSSLVGECDLKVQELANKGGTNSWFTIMYKGESAGKVHLDTTWLKDQPEPVEEVKEAINQ